MLLLVSSSPFDRRLRREGGHIVLWGGLEEQASCKLYLQIFYILTDGIEPRWEVQGKPKGSEGKREAARGVP